MSSTSAMYVAVTLMLAAFMGAAFARWRRALSDLQKTVESIPVLRRATYQFFRRMVVFGGGLALFLYVMARGGSG